MLSFEHLVQLINWEHFVQICGYLAPISSVIVGLSPYPTIRWICRHGKVENYPLLPYTSMVITSTLSFAYGLLRGSFVIWSCSAIALILGIYYLLCYIQFAHTAIASSTLPGKVEHHTMAVFVAMMFTVLWIIAPFTPSNPDWLIGKVSLLFRILMFGSPLTTLRIVIQTQCAKSIPLPFAIAVLINCVLWIVFGMYQVKDPNIYLPNLLGLVFALAQLSVKIHYRRNSNDSESSVDELPIHQPLISIDDNPIT